MTSWFLQWKIWKKSFYPIVADHVNHVEFFSDSRGAGAVLNLHMWEAGHYNDGAGFSDVICYFSTGANM